MLVLKFFPRGDGAVNNAPAAPTQKRYYIFSSKKFGWAWVFLLAIAGSLLP